MRRCIACIVLVTFVLSFPLNLLAVDQKEITGFEFEENDQSYFNRRLSSFVEENKTVQKKQLIIGHSMGGLIAMGVLNAVKGSVNQPSGVITVNSPVTGFAGLDYGFDRMKANVLDAVQVHTRGISAVIGLIPLGEVFIAGKVFQALSFVLPEVTTVSGVSIMGAFLKAVDKTALVSAVMESSGFDNKALLIKDMGKASEYVKNNVQETKIWYEREITGYKTVLDIEWRTKKILFVTVSYPVVVSKTVPVYGDVKKSKIVVSHRTDVPIGHVVGTDNDPLRMAGSDEDLFRGILATSGAVYGLAATANTVLAVSTFPIGTVYYGLQAARAVEASNWCINYKDRWGDIIGGRQNDGFITTATQRTYWNTNVDPKGVDYYASIKIDHARSSPDRSSTDSLNYQVWGPGGLVAQIAKKMGADYNPLRK